MSSPQSPSLRPAFVTIAPPPPPRTPPQPIKMSVTTPPPAPKKRPAFFTPAPMSPPKKDRAELALDEMLDRAFPPGQFVPIVLPEEEIQRILEESWKNLPAWFHFEEVNGVLCPRSFEDKKKLLAALEKQL